jgi:hypothetical protein
MPECHPWTGVSHHLPDLLPHIRFIAMYPAVSTGGFPLLKRAFVKVSLCVIEKTHACRAKVFAGFMHVPAIDIEHCLNCFSLPYHPALFHEVQLPVVDKFNMEIKVLFFQHLYQRLEIINLLCPDPHLVFLDFHLNLKLRLFNQLCDILCPLR